MKRTLTKKHVVIIVVLLITAVTFALCINAMKVEPIGADALNLKIVLDAGHGGVDGGVTGINTGVKESDLNLEIVKILKKKFENAGIDVVLTRSSEAGLYGSATTSRKKKDMQKRKEIIEKAKPDVVLSIHMNKYSVSTRRGAQVFFKDSSETGKLLAESVQKSLNAMEGSPREYSALKGDYYILNCTDYPSLIVECGFLSNPEDEALLLTEEYRDKISYTIFKGVINYLTESTFYAGR